MLFQFMHRIKTGILIPLTSLVTLFSVGGCSDLVVDSAINLRVSKAPLIVKIHAIGELEAAESVQINIPSDVFEPQVIEWLLEENTQVNKGDLVARLDASKYRFQTNQEKLQVKKSDIGYQSKSQSLDTEEKKINNDILLVDEEIKTNQKYAVDDLRVYSKNEIIDATSNLQYLQSKEHYYQWLSKQHQNKAETELELISLKQKQHETKLAMYKMALGKLEIRAPKAGVFILSQNWRGDKPSVGSSQWPGAPIGEIPDLSKMVAKIYVLELDAAGLKTGLPVEMRLDAFPEDSITGKVIAVDAISKTINNENPTKYFEAKVSIDVPIKSEWRPGSQLSAKITTIEIADTITLPTVAVNKDSQGNNFVWLKRNGEWQKELVKTGARTLSRTEIIEGLAEGDIVRLVPVEEKS